VRYGNTSCLEVRCGPHLLILDGGSGMRPLGKALMAEAPIDADIFFTHTHLDHIVGLPFFAPLYQPSSNLRLWAGHLKPRTTLKDALGHDGGAAVPVPPDVFASRPTITTSSPATCSRRGPAHRAHHAAQPSQRRHRLSRRLRRPLLCYVTTISRAR
jgi:phosphoribosyl 1,2-cyclic phosphodiesterase